MTIAILVVATAAMAALVSALLASQACKQALAAVEDLREASEQNANRIAGMADRILPLEAATRRMEAEVGSLSEWRAAHADTKPRAKKKS